MIKLSIIDKQNSFKLKVQEPDELKLVTSKTNVPIGPYYTPNIKDGYISWTNNGGLDNPEPVPFPSSEDVEMLKQEVGNLEELETEDKSSLVNAINEIISEPHASSWDTLLGKPFDYIGDNLKVVDRRLCVDTTQEVEQDNTKPITSAAVYTEVGNINVLLSLI